jgi:transcription termination/antitermination protein NusA
MKNEFEVAFNEIAETRALPAEIVQEALQSALFSAYRKYSGASAGQNVEATIDPGTGRTRIFVEKEVVEVVENNDTEVDLEKARYYDPECDIGDTVMVQIEGTTKRFGRIAAQTAKQVILQRIREAEREALYEEYIDKVGDIINGQVQSANSAYVTLSLGRAEAILPRHQQIPGERYRQHDKVRCFVVEVRKSNRGPQIVVSRSHRNMLRSLLEFEVPEIFNGQIEIKNIAREAGRRSKVAVVALQEGIDPVGACVGMRGIRIQNIVKELHDEKIDVIEWNPDQELFIEKSLSPARVAGVYLDDDPDEGRTAVVLVPDDQLSLAIGREGQNARLAAKLTGWRIDIKSVMEAVQGALGKIDSPTLLDLTVSHAELLADVSLIIEKKMADRAIMPEEYRTLNEFANLVEIRFQQKREEKRQARLVEINAVKSTLPKFAFEIPVQDLDLPDEMIEALQPLGNVGEIMLRFLIDENRLRRLLKRNTEDALLRVQAALDKLVIPDEAEMALETEKPVDDAVEVMETAETAEKVEEAPETAIEAEDVQELAKDVVEAVPPSTQPEEEKLYEVPPDLVEDLQEEPDIFLDDELKGQAKLKKERQKRRQLVFDEDTGKTIAKRRRKGGRKRSDWDDSGDGF